MLTEERANHFVAEWIDAWNSRDLERVLRHWRDDCVFASPLVSKITGDISGTVRGKAALRAYWERGLASNPDLHFELLHVHIGHHSVVIGYRNHRGQTCAEMVELDAD